MTGPLGGALGAPDVHLRDGLLAHWQHRNLRSTLPHVVEQLRHAGNLANFRRIVENPEVPYAGAYPFLDTDVYKTLEGLVYELARPDTESEPVAASLVDFYEEAVDLISRAQAPDGYLGTAFQGIPPLREQWADLAWSHEMYNLGHLVQAAVAASRQLGDARLLGVACRFADLVVCRYGDDGEALYGGHPEVEMALVELHRETGDPVYLRQAQLFIDRRGTGALTHSVFPPEYFQDAVPLRELDSVTGHAVRMVYLAAGATDVARETEDAELLEHLEYLWDDMVATKSYLTGGLGARHSDEAFGDRYELPSERAYAETCAAIGAMQWGWRLFVTTGRADVLDAYERILYNAYAVGLANNGKAFFYDNPLQRRPDHEQRSGAETGGAELRRGWFGCACCPPNLVRWMAQLQDHVAVADESSLTLALYASCRIASQALDVDVATGYPFDGLVAVTVTRTVDRPVTLRLRVPGWAGAAAGLDLTVEGEPAKARFEKGWVLVTRQWSVGEALSLRLPLEARMVTSHPYVDATRGAAAVLRGPLVYCAEQQDAPGAVDDLVLVGVESHERADDGVFTGRPGLTGGVDALVETRAPASSALYPDLDAVAVSIDASDAAAAVQRMPLVPYFQWGNREPGPMRVWLRQK
ncbi:hypothetical protein BA895_05675 [Humibacillus sp. DSM 29435]|nr:hypothetical protein BA895_05675 [Humibacillus sp. DSM 29435]